MTDKEAIDIIYSVSSKDFILNDEQRKLITDALNHLIICTEQIIEIKKILENDNNYLSEVLIKDIGEVLYGMDN